MNAEIRVGFCVVGMGRFFYRHAALSFSSVRPPRQREGACHVNRTITSQSLLAKGGLSRLGYPSAQQNAAVKDAQRGEAGSLTAAGCCATHGEYGGIANMKTQKKQNIDVLRPCPKRLPVPDHADMVTEDGTIYHVQSFFVGNAEMCDLLDALTIEAIERVK